MFKTVYLACGSLAIVGYLGWTLMGMELGTSSRESVPKIQASSSGSSHARGRSRYGYFGSGSGFGFGK